MIKLAPIGGPPADTLTALPNPHPILEQEPYKGLTMEKLKEMHQNVEKDAEGKVAKLTEAYTSAEAKFRKGVLTKVKELYPDFKTLMENELKENGALKLGSFPTTFEHVWRAQGKRAVITVPNYVDSLWFINVKINGNDFPAWTVHFSKEIELNSKAYRARKMAIYKTCAEELGVLGLAGVDAEIKCRPMGCPPGTVMIGTMYWNPSNKEQCGNYSQEVWKFEGKCKSRMTPQNFQHHMKNSYSEQKLADDGDRILGKCHENRCVPVFKVDAVGFPDSDWPFMFIKGKELDFSKS
eukprot:jgi/Bigna1/85440/estExt_fgenesh1_pg.C_40095